MKVLALFILTAFFSGLWVCPAFAGPNDPPSSEAQERDDRDEDDGEDWFEDAPEPAGESLEDRIFQELGKLPENRQKEILDREGASKNGGLEDSMAPRTIHDLGGSHLEEGAASEETLSVPDHTVAQAPVLRKRIERPLEPLDHQGDTTAAPHDRVKPLREALERERKQDQLVEVASEGRVLTVDPDSSSDGSSDASPEESRGEEEESRRSRGDSSEES